MDNKSEQVKKYYSDSIQKDHKKTNCCSQKNTEIITYSCYNMLPKLKERIQERMTVIDLGSGSGHDVIQAAHLVGENGRVIGVDFSKAMIEEAKKNIELEKLSNAEIIDADIARVPLPDKIADIIISNCVVNLHQNKSEVLQEAYRLLKPGGFLLNADTITKKPFPKKLQADPELWCACISGSLTESEYKQILEQVGFENIIMKSNPNNAILIEKAKQKVNSVLIEAKKPTQK